jgi:hypothetical protein
MDAHNETEFASQEALAYWESVITQEANTQLDIVPRFGTNLKTKGLHPPKNHSKN